jgi:hypothetical protein
MAHFLYLLSFLWTTLGFLVWYLDPATALFKSLELSPLTSAILTGLSSAFAGALCTSASDALEASVASAFMYASLVQVVLAANALRFAWSSLGLFAVLVGLTEFVYFWFAGAFAVAKSARTLSLAKIFTDAHSQASLVAGVTFAILGSYILLLQPPSLALSPLEVAFIASLNFSLAFTTVAAAVSRDAGMVSRGINAGLVITLLLLSKFVWPFGGGEHNEAPPTFIASLVVVAFCCTFYAGLVPTVHQLKRVDI